MNKPIIAQSLMPPLESERLLLVPLTLAQMEQQLRDYAGLERSLGVPPGQGRLPARLRSVVANSITQMERDPATQIWHTYWVMVCKEDPAIVGGLGFKGTAQGDGEVEIGYGVEEDQRGRGYATEAVIRLAEWAFAQPGIRSILAETANTNADSMRVLQRVGFQVIRANPRFLYWRLTPQQLAHPHSGEAAHAAQNDPAQQSDRFALYDLTVVVEAIHGHCTCDMAVGDRFHLRRSSKLSLPEGGSFCIWALNSVLPLLTAKQRANHPADWIETDSRVICPDPACGLIMRIDREALTHLRHDEVSPIPWEEIRGGEETHE